MSFEDFLGKTVEIGDLVIFTPQSRGGDLVLGELIDLKTFIRYRWTNNAETGERESEELPYFKPVIQPLDGVDKYRFKDWKNGEYVPKTARPVTLTDCDSVMLYKKGNDNERVGSTDSLS